MPIYFHSHFVKIFLKIHLSGKENLLPLIFFVLSIFKKTPKKPQESKKGKVKYNLNLLTYGEACLGGFHWNLWAMWLSPAPFDIFALLALDQSLPVSWA